MSRRHPSVSNVSEQVPATCRSSSLGPKERQRWPSAEQGSREPLLTGRATASHRLGRASARAVAVVADDSNDGRRSLWVELRFGLGESLHLSLSECDAPRLLLEVLECPPIGTKSGGRNPMTQADDSGREQGESGAAPDSMSPLETEVVARLRLRRRTERYLLTLRHRLSGISGLIRGEALLLAEKLEAQSDVARNIALLSKETERLSEVVAGMGRTLDLILERSSPRSVQICGAIEDACEFARNRGIQVHVDCPRNLPTVMGLDEDIAELFEELANNALRALKGQSGEIWVTATHQPNPPIEFRPTLSPHQKGFVCITFEDNGPGIPPERKSDIFRPHYTTHGAGTGWGLALVRQTVEATGGRILESGKYGEGARFYMCFPAGE